MCIRDSTNPDMLAANGSMSIGVINLQEVLGVGGVKPIQWYYHGEIAAGVPEFSKDPTYSPLTPLYFDAGAVPLTTQEVIDLNAPSPFFGPNGAGLAVYEVEGANLGNVGGENSTHSSTHVSLFTPDGHVSGILFITAEQFSSCLLYTSPSPRDLSTSRMPSSA